LIGGPGITTIEPGSQWKISGSGGGKAIDSHVIVNNGTVGWFAGDIVMSNGAAFVTYGGGTFSAQGNNRLIQGSGPVSSFQVNGGGASPATFIKSGGTGVTSFDGVQFNVTGP